MHDYIKQIAILYRVACDYLQSNQEKPYYRIIKVPSETDKNIHFQVIGKNLIFNMLPEKIMRDNILMGFSRADVATITHLGTKHEITSTLIKPQNKIFKIIKEIFSGDKTKFIIEKEDGEVVEHGANDLVNNLSITERLNGTDGIKIGYTAAEEHYAKLNKLKKKQNF